MLDDDKEVSKMSGKSVRKGGVKEVMLHVS